MDKRSLCLIALAGATLASAPRVAAACGCFALASPANPVVQAGERILFAREGNQVVAYIQIQYQGRADDFGWLLPLPSVPTLELGSEEVFNALGESTQPRYRLTTTTRACDGSTSSSTRDSGGGFGCGGAASFGAPTAPKDQMREEGKGPVVIRDTIGPYEYAVLRADSRDPMLQWLADNGFFVPTGTGDVIAPYIHRDAYFLALKLRAGEMVGDLQPVVVRYPSDLPMIPIILTQVGAVPDMGILVWLLGEARAIPRNYHHVALNDMPMWMNPATSYQSLVTRAVKEAPARHAFLTEYAGPSSVMAGTLDPPGRFGDLAVLRATSDAATYLAYLRANGYRFDRTLLSVLLDHIRMPQSLVDEGVPPALFYDDFVSYRDRLLATPPDGGPPPDFSYDPVALTDEIEARVVRPTQAAAALFRAHPYLTRLYTTLSPEDMTADPVFSENPELPPVPALREATLTLPCLGQPWLANQDGLRVQYPRGTANPPVPVMPASLRVEVLRDSGAPEVASDNRAAIQSALGPVDTGDGATPTRSPGAGAGCSCSLTELTRGNAATLALVALALLALRLTGRRARRDNVDPGGAP